MNNINTNSEPIIGTRNGWGKIALFWMVVLVLGIMSKGCNDNDQTPMFIINQHQ